MKFSMVSFGAPPVFGHLGSLEKSTPNQGLVLSIVNEYDLVPRADQAYIRSLVDLYRSIYHLPPIQDDRGQEAVEFHLPRLSFDLRNSLKDKKIDALWSLPRPVYWHIGRIVVLKVSLMEKKGEENEEDEWMLRALTVKPEDFARLLFCNVDIHKRLRYRERIDMLLEGRFNGREGWQ
jgi:hypothetical protein